MVFSKQQKSWAFYDWANSVYPLVITSAIFPIFYEAVSTTKDAAGNVISDTVLFFGMEFTNTVLISYISSFIFLVVSLCMSILSGVADFYGKKRSFLIVSFLIGASGCAGLFFFDIEKSEMSMLYYVFAGVGFWLSLVFYNAYLPQIAPIHLQDRLSARGYSLGYLGSSILLIACLVGIMVLDVPAKYAFLLTAIWWLAFGFYSVLRLPKSVKNTNVGRPLKHGWEQLISVWKQLRNLPVLKKYLRAFFVYSMGVQTVMIMAVYFGAKEINWPDSKAQTTGLIVSVLLIQFIAIGGSVLLSKLSSKKGNVFALQVVLFAWIGLCISALWVTEPLHFYIIAAFVGLVMGGVQSLSRSTYSKLLPQDCEEHTAFFSFYDLSEKIGIIIGTFSYGYIESFTGSMRNSIFALIVFFIAGYFLLRSVQKENSKKLNPYNG
jgi:UMF1 family MFS transporter